MLGDCKIPGVKHALSMRGGVQAGSLEVLNHSPGAPAANHLSDEWVNAGPDEGHTATVAKSAGRNVFGRKAQLLADDLAGGAELVGDILASDEVLSAIAVVVGTQRSVGWSVVATEHEDLVAHSFHRGQQRVGGVPNTNGLAFRAVLLISEVQHDTGCSANRFDGPGGPVAWAPGSFKGDVFEPEGMVVAATVGVFAGPENTEVSSHGHVGASSGKRG